MLEGYIVTLPDGSQGSLMAFYEGIMDESITATDAGYVLSDGTLLPTNGEAMWNPDADVLITLMSPYLSDGTESSSGDDGALDEDADSDGSGGQDPYGMQQLGMIRIFAIGVVGYLIYKEFND
tara:strand:- start:697 stop:1065 length:369 start_codon:yes stop_codon:yes gene_type:complete